MNNLKTNNATIEFDGDTVVKIFDEPISGINDFWLSHYQNLRKRNDHIVDVIEIIEPQYAIRMERLEILEVVRNLGHKKNAHLKKYLTQKTLVNIITALNLTWVDSFQYSLDAFPDGRIFIHIDFHLHNVVLCEDGKVKIIDPDSFRICNDFEHISKFHMSQLDLNNMMHLYFGKNT